MPLSLKILSIKDEPVSKAAVVFGNEGSIGRLGSNTLVLPDPDKFVSRKHALINRENQQYLLKDLSLSGTYIDQQLEPLATKTQILSDGMHLRIGHYKILVSISNDDDNNGLIDIVNDENNELNNLLSNQQDTPFITIKDSPFESLENANFSSLHDSFTPPTIQPDNSKHGEMPEDFNFEDLFEQPASINKSPSVAAPQVSNITTENSQLYTDFLQGAGLNEQLLTTIKGTNTLRHIGQMFRKLVSGMMLMLKSRTELKNMFKVNQTYIQTQDNNVLKFASSTNEALSYLITNNEAGFKDSLTAIDEGFEDIMQHQIAMQAAIQVSLQELLKKFDPQLIDQQFEESLLLQKKSKCWEKYLNNYPQLKEQVLDDFFGENFVKTYEQKITQLKQTKIK
jgi:type VI secretion system FHA domain protein